MRAVGKYVEAALAKRKKEQSRLSRESDCMVGESQGGREQHFGERGRIRAGAWKGERMSSMVKESRFQGGEGGLARRGRRKHERVSGRKSSPGRSAVSWFHSKSGQT